MTDSPVKHLDRYYYREEIRSCYRDLIVLSSGALAQVCASSLSSSASRPLDSVVICLLGPALVAGSCDLKPVDDLGICRHCNR